MSRYSLLSNGNLKVTLQVKLTRQSGRTRILSANDTHIDMKMVLAFARARHWQKLIDDGKYVSTIDLGRNIGMDNSYVARIMRLNLISPRVVRSVMNGTAPSGLSLGMLTKSLPPSWEEQEVLLGFSQV
ncbi:MAG: hypothetical protein RR053_04065 [Evtepia sp.]